MFKGQFDSNIGLTIVILVLNKGKSGFISNTLNLYGNACYSSVTCK